MIISHTEADTKKYTILQAVWEKSKVCPITIQSETVCFTEGGWRIANIFAHDQATGRKCFNQYMYIIKNVYRLVSESTIRFLGTYKLWPLYNICYANSQFRFLSSLWHFCQSLRLHPFPSTHHHLCCKFTQFFIEILKYIEMYICTFIDVLFYIMSCAV